MRADNSWSDVLPEQSRKMLFAGEELGAGEALVVEARRRARSDPASAGEWADEILLAVPADRAMGPFARWAAGVVHFLGGRASRAQPLLESAARSFAARRLPEYADRVRLLLIDAYGEALDINKARRLAGSLEKRFRARGDHQRAGIALSNLGCAEDAIDRVKRAATLWRKALRDLEGERVPSLLVRANLANAALLAGNIDQALADHREVITSASVLGLEDIEIQAEINLGEAEFAAGQLRSAFDRWLRVVERAGRCGNELLGVFARLELAEAEVKVGNFPDARTRLGDVLPRLEVQGLEVEVARVRRMLIVLELSAEKPDLDALTRARRSLERPGLEIQRDLLVIDLAQFQALAHSFVVDGEDLLKAATRLRKNGLENRADIGVAWAACGYFSQGRTKRAVNLASTLLDGPRRSPWARLIAHWVLARNFSSGRSGWRHLRAAVRIADSLHGRLAAVSDRAAFLSVHTEIYLELIWRLVERGTSHDRKQAMTLVNRLKSSWVFDELTRRTQSPSRAADPRIRRWVELRSRLASMLESASGEKESRVRRSGFSAAVRLGGLEREIHSIETDLARSNPDFANIVLGQARFEDFGDRIPSGHLLVEYFLGRDDLLIFVLDRSTVEVIRVKACADELRALVSSVRFHMDTHPWAEGRKAGFRQKSLDARLRRLGEFLLDPIEKFPREALWIAPHDILFHLPWTALVTPSDEYLIEHELFTLVPGAAVMNALLRKSNLAPQSWVFSSAGSDVLPKIKEELTFLGGIFPHAETMPKISCQGFLELLATHDAVHLAGHALFLDGIPSASGLRLEDGYVTVHDIAATPVRASLVSFGVCSGLRLAQRSHDHYEGFLRVLLGRGVQRVVGPIAWVEDQVASSFDQHFYTGLATGEESGGAFRKAIEALKLEDAHPATWGSFQHYGDLRPWRSA